MNDNDNLEKVNCPACGYEMTKIYIPEGKFFVDICTDNCGGIFFDKSEFDKFAVEKISIGAIRSVIADLKFNYVSKYKVHVCPKCNVQMEKFNYNGLEMYKCPHCESVFG